MRTTHLVPRTAASRIAILAVILSGAIGFAAARFTERGTEPAASSMAGSGKVLYWYDPMVPGQHFDKPGLSPMGMKMVPRYADGNGENSAPGVSISAAQIQNLGARIVPAEIGTLTTGATATGTIAFNEREVAIVQARSGGFVQRVYARAPGDVVRAGAPIADLLVPDWGGAQAEYLAVRRTGNAALANAARQRLILLGMPEGLVEQVARTGRMRNVVTISTPIGGAIKTLTVRQGMTVSAGETLAEVDGLATVWLNAAVPEVIAGTVRIGAPATATLAAFPDKTFTGRVTAILPTTDITSRTLTVRIELPNRGGHLRPGMFATVSLGGGAREALLVPSEAVIRTGTRTLVMLARPGGRYRPAEVRIGTQSGDHTEILAGLSPGEKVVASGQFLIDSEASLAGVPARPIGGEAISQPPEGPTRRSIAHEAGR